MGVAPIGMGTIRGAGLPETEAALSIIGSMV